MDKTTDIDQRPIREAQKDLTRQRLVKAARSIFERDGFGGASIGAIAEVAGVNRATFYLHFPNKEAVFREVIHHDSLGTTKYWTKLNAALIEGTREAVSDWIKELKSWYRDHAMLMPAKHEAMAREDSLAPQFQPRYDELAVQLEEYLDQFPPDRRVDERIRVQLLVVMIDQIFFHALVQGVWSGPEDQLTSVVIDIMVKALSVEG